MEELAHEGATMIVVTHEMAFAREAADRVYFIDEGRFVEVGPPEQVIDAPQDPRTREFLARTHGTGAHVHGGATTDATSEAVDTAHRRAHARPGRLGRRAVARSSLTKARSCRTRLQAPPWCTWSHPRQGATASPAGAVARSGPRIIGGWPR